MTAPEAGWYDDGSGKQRWWDGARWTEEYIDLREPDTQLRSDSGPVGGPPASAGWYDDGRGRQRWWDGRQWTRQSRFSGEERAFAGIVVDGRWIHCGDRSAPVAGATATLQTGAELLKGSIVPRAAVAGTLAVPSGAVTSRTLKRNVPPGPTYLVVQVNGQVWISPIPAGPDAEARRFATWIETVGDHYRYR